SADPCGAAGGGCRGRRARLAGRSALEADTRRPRVHARPRRRAHPEQPARRPGRGERPQRHRRRGDGADRGTDGGRPGARGGAPGKGREDAWARGAGPGGRGRQNPAGLEMDARPPPPYPATPRLAAALATHAGYLRDETLAVDVTVGPAPAAAAAATDTFEG